MCLHVPLHYYWNLYIDPTLVYIQVKATTNCNSYCSFVCNMKRPLWSKSKFRSELKFGRWTFLLPMDPPPHLLARLVLGRQTFFCQWTTHLLVRLVLGRWTFFGRWTPWIQHRCLECQYTTLGRKHTFSDRPPNNQVEMPWIPVHTAWHTNLLWLIDPYMLNGNFTLLLTI